MLTLDETTLYYFFLSDAIANGKDFSSGINDWAASIPDNARPATASQPSILKNNKRSRTSGSAALPPLTVHGSTRSSAKSVLTDNVLILHKAAVPVKPKVKKQDALQVIERGLGLSDDDDTQALEREAAVCSPPKGKKRVTSSVSVQ
jgi:hypothetical protein